jgi:hypothetical protein
MMRAGLDDYDYLFGLAVDSGDPKFVIVSASQWPRKAYSPEDAESLVYRRTSSVDDTDDYTERSSDGEWNVVSNGLSEPKGTLISCSKSNNCRRILCCKQSWNILLY